MTELTMIGYWNDISGDGTGGLPNPSDFVDHSWDEDERDLVVEYLRGGLPVIHMMGHSPCRICGKENGTSEQTDGMYLWPSGLAHYVADHGVRLPGAVVERMVTRFRTLEAQAVDAHRNGPRAWTAMTTG